jgi:hypothetical protein
MPLANFSGLFRRECKYNLFLLTLYIYCAYPAMPKSKKQLEYFTEKSRNKCYFNLFKGGLLSSPSYNGGMDT